MEYPIFLYYRLNKLEINVFKLNVSISYDIVRNIDPFVSEPITLDNTILKVYSQRCLEVAIYYRVHYMYSITFIIIFTSQGPIARNYPFCFHSIKHPRASSISTNTFDPMASSFSYINFINLNYLLFYKLISLKAYA